MKIFNKITIALSVSLFVILFIISIVFAILFKIGIASIPIWATFLVFIVLFLAIFFVYVIYLWMPIEKISEAIASLIQWNEYIEIEVSREDELWEISHFINQVVDKVKKLSWELLQWRRVLWEVNTARTIQRNILPNSVPEWIIWLDIIARSKASSEVWWDNFDIIQSWGNTIFYIWDVTGHWVPAALIMTMANTAIRAYIWNWLVPKEVFLKTNALLFQKITTSHFMSAVMLRWDNEKQKMFYTWAWHETILIYSKATWKVTNIKSWWIALKMIKNIDAFVEEKELQFEVWDTLLLYSDWITEAKDQFWKRYGVERFINTIESYGSDKIRGIFEWFTNDYSDFVWSHPQEDDVTLIVIKNIWHYWREPVIDICSKQTNNTWITWINWTWD